MKLETGLMLWYLGITSVNGKAVRQNLCPMLMEPAGSEHRGGVEVVHQSYGLAPPCQKLPPFWKSGIPSRDQTILGSELCRVGCCNSITLSLTIGTVAYVGGFDPKLGSSPAKPPSRPGDPTARHDIRV